MNPTSLPASTEIGAVRLSVADLDRSAEFYSGLLGLRAIDRDSTRLSLGAGADPIVVLEQTAGLAHRPEGTPGLYHVAILLPDRATLGLELRRLFEARWPFHGFADHGVSEAAYLADPDGNGIELYADRPREAWPRRDGAIEMFTLALDVADLLRAGTGLAWTGAAPGTRIGHIHLHVDDLLAAERFWVDTVGFDVITRAVPGALFLAAGGYHHHVGLNTWVRGRPRPRDVAGMLDVTVRVHDRAARQALRDRLANAGSDPVDFGEGFRCEDPEGNGLVISP